MAAFKWPSLARNVSGKFDYYTLALSWSPTHCASKAGRGDNLQCGPGRKYTFVVHGLWPQHRSGWPDFCATSERYVPNVLIEEMLPIMPSKRLVVHEWRKHGTCSGLSQEHYFSLTRELFSRLQVPARYIAPAHTVEITPSTLREDFLKTNNWLKPEMISIQCGNSRDRGVLRGVRVCFGRNLQPAAPTKRGSAAPAHWFCHQYGNRQSVGEGKCFLQRAAGRKLVQ
ncbi:MAG: ribonuclease T2 family protein [Hyphomicrobiales bacterium]